MEAVFTWGMEHVSIWKVIKVVIRYWMWFCAGWKSEKKLSQNRVKTEYKLIQNWVKTKLKTVLLVEVHLWLFIWLFFPSIYSARVHVYIYLHTCIMAVYLALFSLYIHCIYIFCMAFVHSSNFSNFLLFPFAGKCVVWLNWVIMMQHRKYDLVAVLFHCLCRFSPVSQHVQN